MDKNTDKYQQKEAEIAILITDKVEFKVKIMKYRIMMSCTT